MTVGDMSQVGLLEPLFFGRLNIAATRIENKQFVLMF